MSVLSASLGGTRRLALSFGQYGLLFGPIRRAVVEPAAATHDELLRLLICYLGKRLWETGLIGGRCGNLSARSRQRDAILITRRGVHKGRLSVTDVLRVPLDPGPGETRAASVEFPTHRACYRARADVGAVIHTHAPALTALGIRRLELADWLPEAAETVGPLARVPAYPSGSPLLAEAVGAAVADGARLLLLERHGALAVGRDLDDAYDRMELAELSAKAVLLAAGP